MYERVSVRVCLVVGLLPLWGEGLGIDKMTVTDIFTEVFIHDKKGKMDMKLSRNTSYNILNS